VHLESGFIDIGSSLGRVYRVFVCVSCTAHDHGSGTPSGAQSCRNTGDRNNEHPVTPKLIIITTCFKSSIDKVHSVVDYLKILLA
jgi:hypothetical protein